MKIGKYNVKLVFRFQSLWIGIYPNTLRGKLCIAFLPFCVLRIVNRHKHYQCENAMLKDALGGLMQEYECFMFKFKGTSGKTYHVEHLKKVINNNTVGN